MMGVEAAGCWLKMKEFKSESIAFYEKWLAFWKLALLKT